MELTSVGQQLIDKFEALGIDPKRAFPERFLPIAVIIAVEDELDKLLLKP